MRRIRLQNIFKEDKSSISLKGVSLNNLWRYDFKKKGKFQNGSTVSKRVNLRSIDLPSSQFPGSIFKEDEFEDRWAISEQEVNLKINWQIYLNEDKRKDRLNDHFQEAMED